MNTIFYRVKCLTNLHIGSGDINYSTIDLEVERDPVLGEPVMNASGVKGAIRDFCEAEQGDDNETVEFIFGSRGSGTKPGNYNFFSGDLLARPVRVSRGESAYVLATTKEMINHFLRKAAALGVCLPDGELPELPTDGKILCSKNCSLVEGKATIQAATPCKLLEKLLGTDSWALMTPEQLSEIDLPVLAHNVLDDNGISKNLWYEQVVPHESVFAILISGPDGDQKLAEFLGDAPVIQFGAGASTGTGYTKLERMVYGDE